MESWKLRLCLARFYVLRLGIPRCFPSARYSPAMSETAFWGKTDDKEADPDPDRRQGCGALKACSVPSHHRLTLLMARRPSFVSLYGCITDPRSGRLFQSGLIPKKKSGSAVCRGRGIASESPRPVGLFIQVRNGRHVVIGLGHSSNANHLSLRIRGRCNPRPMF